MLVPDGKNILIVTNFIPQEREVVIDIDAAGSVGHKLLLFAPKFGGSEVFPLKWSMG